MLAPNIRRTPHQSTEVSMLGWKIHEQTDLVIKDIYLMIQLIIRFKIALENAYSVTCTRRYQQKCKHIKQQPFHNMRLLNHQQEMGVLVYIKRCQIKLGSSQIKVTTYVAGTIYNYKKLCYGLILYEIEGKDS